jgi:hypothetical protein
MEVSKRKKRVLMIVNDAHSQVRYLRKPQNLKIFAPVADLSAISKVEAGRNNEISVAGGRVLGDEWTEHVVKVISNANRTSIGH